MNQHDDLLRRLGLALLPALMLLLATATAAKPPATDPPLRGSEFARQEVAPGDLLVFERDTGSLYMDGAGLLVPEFRPGGRKDGEGVLYVNGLQIFPTRLLSADELAKESKIEGEMLAAVRRWAAPTTRVTELLDGRDPAMVDDDDLRVAWIRYEAELKELWTGYQEQYRREVRADKSPAGIMRATNTAVEGLRHEPLIVSGSVILEGSPSSRSTERQISFKVQGSALRHLLMLSADERKGPPEAVSRDAALARWNTIRMYLQDDGSDMAVDISKGLTARPRHHQIASPKNEVGGVINWYPCNYELWDLYDPITWQQHAVEGPIRMGVAPDKVTLYDTSLATNHPEPWTSIVTDMLFGAAHFATVTHGAAVGSEAALALEFYLDRAYAMQRWESYANSGYIGSGFRVGLDPEGYYGLFMLPEAVRLYIKPHADARPGVTWLTACNSALAVPSWTDAGPGTASSAVGYGGDVSAADGVMDHMAYIEATGCYLYVAPWLIENTFGDAWSAGSRLATFFGSPRGRFSIGCQEWGVLEDVDAFAGQVHVLVAEQTEGEQLIVLGRGGSDEPNRDAPPDTVRVVDARHGDGAGLTRYYAVDVGGYEWYQVVLWREFELPQSSEWVRMRTTPRDDWIVPPEFLPGGEYKRHDQTMSSHERVGNPSNGGGTKSDLHCDVIVYYKEQGSDEIIWEAQAARGQAQSTTVEGSPLSARMFGGDFSFADVNGLYREVVAANAAYNLTGPPVPVRAMPVLCLVGGPHSGLEYVMLPNESHLQRWWWLLAPYTDIDGDMIGDGALVHWQTSGFDQAQTLAAAGRDFNQQRFAGPGGVTAFIAGDRARGGILPAFGDTLAEVFRGYCEARHHRQLRPLLRSRFPEGWDGELQMRAAGTQLLAENDVREVVFWDLRSSATFTEALEGEVANWNRAGRPIFIAPTCNVGAMYESYGLRHPRFLDMMDRTLDGTVFAGGIGNLNAATDAMHREMATVTAEVLAAFQPGRLYADAVKDIQAELIRRHPEDPQWASYAQGVIWVGAFVTVPQAGVAAVHDGPVANKPGFELECDGVGAGTVLRYALPLAGTVEIEVYDVRGRRVQRLLAASRTGGAHEVAWRGRDDSGRPLASGVYFAQLRVDGEPKAQTKLTLVR